MKNDVSGTIFFRFSNGFTKSEIFVLKLPFKPFLATKGFYSSLYKALKEKSAHNFENSLVVGKTWFTTEKSKRLEIRLPGGYVLDAPSELSVRDVEIIKHQIDGVKMSLQ